MIFLHFRCRITTILLLISGTAFCDRSFLDGDLDLAEGIKLVSIPVSNSLDEESGRSFGDDSPLYRMAKFLQGHELRVNLPNLIEKEKITNIVSESLKSLDVSKESAVTGRKKGDGGGGLALMGLMMAKTVGAIGIGGLGLLTMKALMASALALMLAAIVGIKKLSSGHDDGGHQVYHVEAGHHHEHRRRRDVNEEFETPLPYKGWSEYNPYKHSV